MKFSNTQIKKANKGLNLRGLNMSKLYDGSLHVGIVSILDMNNQDVLTDLDIVRKELNKTDSLNAILWMWCFN